jgi:Fe2+ or Zn2+ uptake regulation protein
MLYRKSRQRQRILALLQRSKGHPTADYVYQELKKDFPKLSLGNVYRNLQILHEQGLINKIKWGATFDRFDGNPHPHYHFQCEKCQVVTDLDMPFKKELNLEAEHHGRIQIYSHSLVFYGVCAACQNKA